MNCSQFAKALAASAGFSAEARQHLRECPACSEVAAIGGRMEDQKIDPAVEQRILDAIGARPEPVRPLAPSWRYAMGLLGIVAATALAGILALGGAGWASDSVRQKIYFMACLSAGILVSTAVIAQLMRPGTRVLLDPARAIALGVAFLAAGTLLYPVQQYDGFIRAAAACVSIGLGHATVVSILALLLVRRSAFLWQPAMTALIALAGGLAGLVVLYVFCPHRDLWHFALGHTTVPLIAALAGAWAGARLRGW